MITAAECIDRSLPDTRAPRLPTTACGAFEAITAPRIATIFAGRWRGSWMSCTRWWRSCASGAATAPAHDLPEAVFRAFTDLIEAEVDEAIAREWIDEIRTRGGRPHDLR